MVIDSARLRHQIDDDLIERLFPGLQDLLDELPDAGVAPLDPEHAPFEPGEREELLGEAMKSRRDKFIVATKIGWKNFNEST